MQRLLLTLPTTAENLALDEWLLNQCEQCNDPTESCEVLRVWENPVHAVVVGRSSRVAEEVKAAYCTENSIECLRRSSGGASVVIGPGCLMYALVLDYRVRPHLKMLDQAHKFVMRTTQKAIESCGINVKFQGTCDLTLDGRKFSGNSLRCQRNSFLYHGTLLFDFDLETVHQCLGNPPRQPDYREGRTHRDFVINLPVKKSMLEDALIESWNACNEYETVDLAAVDTLAKEKYSSQAWTHIR